MTGKIRPLPSDERNYFGHLEIVSTGRRQPTQKALVSSDLHCPPGGAGSRSFEFSGSAGAPSGCTKTSRANSDWTTSKRDPSLGGTITHLSSCTAKEMGFPMGYSPVCSFAQIGVTRQRTRSSQVALNPRRRQRFTPRRRATPSWRAANDAETRRFGTPRRMSILGSRRHGLMVR
jgi:hypothetical protein